MFPENVYTESNQTYTLYVYIKFCAYAVASVKVAIKDAKYRKKSYYARYAAFTQQLLEMTPKVATSLCLNARP